MRLTLDSKTRFTPTSVSTSLPILGISDDRSFLGRLHRSSWCISHEHRNSSSLIQHRYRNILQSPFPSHPIQAIPRIIFRRYPRSIPQSHPIMADQSGSPSLWNRSKRAFGKRSFTFLQHQPKTTEGESNLPPWDRAGCSMASTDYISNTLQDVSFFGPSNPWPDIQFLVPQIPVHIP
jgi:hypothetical protein